MEKYIVNRNELCEEIKNGIVNDTKIKELTRQMSDTIGRARGETEEELEENYRKLFYPQKENPIASMGHTARLVETRKKREHVEIHPSMLESAEEWKERVGARREERQRQYILERRKKIKKVVVGVTLAAALVAGGSVLANKLDEKYDIFEDPVEIVNVISAEEYNPYFEGIELIEYSNGSYTFRDSDGDLFSNYGTDKNHIVNANDFARSMNISKTL